MMGERTKIWTDLIKKILIDWFWLAVATTGVFMMIIVHSIAAPWFIFLPVALIAWWLIINGIVRAFPNGVLPFRVNK